jgi:hypothetical protein
MSRRTRLLLGLLAVGVAALLVLARQGDVLVALIIGVVVLLTGRAVFRGYNVTKGPIGPPEDVVESGTLLVFACEVCGEQLVLLRKGTDVPPRHCAEAMVLRRIPTPERGVSPN